MYEVGISKDTSRMRTAREKQKEDANTRIVVSE